MPDINLPHLPYSNGDVPTGDQLTEMLWSPNATPDSLNVMNGQLDKDNMATGYSLPHRVVKRGQFALGEMVGSTLNHDYFYEQFTGYTTATWCQDPWTGDNKELLVHLVGENVSKLNSPYRPIPNAGKRFYVERTGPVMLTWHIFWVDDDEALLNNTDNDVGNYPTAGTAVQDVNKSTPIRLFLDGIAQDSCYRLLPPGCYSLPLSRQRYWNGHLFIESMTAGWHEAYLGIVCPGSDSTSGGGAVDLHQSRVRARGFRVIQFR